MKFFSDKSLVSPSKREIAPCVIAWTCYLLLFPLLIPLFFRYVLGQNLLSSSVIYNVEITYFILSFVLTVLLMKNFLWRSLEPLRGKLGKLLLTALLGLLAYYMLASFVYSILFSFVEPEETQNQQILNSLLYRRPVPMLICTVLLSPITEECLVRGAVFAPLCRRWPWLAYLLSSILFAGLHVVAGIGAQPTSELLVSFVQYLPAGLVLGAAYQAMRSVWGSIVLHMLVNLVSVISVLLLK